jgi:hypothetical protein
MRNKYIALQAKQRAEVSTLKMFSSAQFDEGAAALGVERADVTSIGGGGYAPRSELPVIDAMFERLHAPAEAALLDDRYLCDALVYELGNHEYCITGRASDALEAVGVTATDARVKRIFNAAREEYLNNCEHVGSATAAE